MALVHKTFAGPLAADDEHRSWDLHETPSAPILQAAKWAAFRGAQQTPSAQYCNLRNGPRSEERNEPVNSMATGGARQRHVRSSSKVSKVLEGIFFFLLLPDEQSRSGLCAV